MNTQEAVQVFNEELEYAEGICVLITTALGAEVRFPGFGRLEQAQTA